MKIFRIALFATLIGIFSIAVAQQMVDPVKWEFSLEYPGNNEVWVVAKANIEEHWHIYDLSQTDPLGPIPTSLRLDNSNDYKIVGKPVSRTKYTEEQDPIFDMALRFYSNTAVFAQKIKLNKAVSKIVGEVEYQACDDEKCTFPDPIPFELNLKTSYFSVVSAAPAAKENVIKEAKPNDDAIFKVDVENADKEMGMVDPVSFKFDIEYLGNHEANLVAVVVLEEGYHIYADLGQAMPIPARIGVMENATLVGNTTSIPGPQMMDNDLNFEGITVGYIDNGATLKQKISLNHYAPKLHGTFSYQACTDQFCVTPQEVDFFVMTPKEWYAEAEEAAISAPVEDTSLWGSYWAGFVVGLLALFTPCVFPMIPMTVTFFLKQSTSRAKAIRNALIFGVSIVGIYVALGTIITLILGPEGMNIFATDPIVNVFLFLIFVVFGISFLGAFEISLPAWIVNKSDAQADKGGLVGIFFMAFTLGLVSFSCTGPLIGGALGLIINGGGSYLGPISIMFGFSSALALPFTLFAIFPSWLASMPKSGGWLNSVKVVLGLAELAFALKFLSNADLVEGWGILPREIFIAIWVVISCFIGLYLIGKLKFSHDSPLDYISTPRILLATVFFAFTIYLLPGMWGAPLNILSGMAPPRNYVEDMNWMNGGSGGSHGSAPVSTDIIFSDDCPNGLPCVKDFEEAKEIAKKLNKPVIIDFTGHACPNCRKMEDMVWSKPEIEPLLRNEFVMASLYVDDRRPLPTAEQTEKELFGKIKKIKTIGNKWSYLQSSRFMTNSQPYYVLIDPFTDEQLVQVPVGYTPDVDEYRAYLIEGIDKFKKLHPAK